MSKNRYFSKTDLTDLTDSNFESSVCFIW